MTEWFVRPMGGLYGLENGTSYDNAWDGLENVVFGEGGVQAGDTLYVCGTYVYIRPITNPEISTQGRIQVLGGTSDSQRTIVRGDYPRDVGIIWMAYGIDDQNWVDEDSNTYSIILDGNHQDYPYFEDISGDSGTVLTKVADLATCQSTAGSYYSSDYLTNSKLYVHCSDNGDPTGRVYLNSFGYWFNLASKNYITFQNIKFMHFGMAGSMWTNATYITYDNCTFKLAGTSGNLFGLGDGNNYIKIKNSDLSKASNGIYNISTTNSAPSNCEYSNNTIHDIGVETAYQNSDAHGIGIQGGNNNILERNEIYNCGSGITFYAFTSQELKNSIVRYNYIHDNHVTGEASLNGIEFNCDNDSTSDKSGNEIYYNIVSNCGAAYRYQFEQEGIFYNNVSNNCTNGFESGRNNDGVGANAKLRNNIFYGSTSRHIYFFTGAETYTIDSNYNDFYPITGNKFRLAGSEQTFAQWQANNKSGCIFDLSSFDSDPLFVDEDNGNFQLLINSPCIDSGVDVGLVYDFYGIQVPRGSGIDIGAHEHQVEETVHISIGSPNSGSIRKYKFHRKRKITKIQDMVRIPAINAKKISMIKTDKRESSKLNWSNKIVPFLSMQQFYEIALEEFNLDQSESSEYGVDFTDIEIKQGYRRL